ncbi:MAG TPA: hypothetical protein VMU09_00170, partial [Acidimicrobiales bacterium]|nr:hypothetical protein [Acidimicrobiales bacterium]
APVFSESQRQGDAYLLAIALRGVLVAVKLVRKKVDAEAKQAIDKAVAEFDAAIPHAKKTRDVIVHMDEYREGNGRIQRVHQPDPNRRFRASQWSERQHPGHYCLVVGLAAPPWELRLDIGVAEQAATAWPTPCNSPRVSRTERPTVS